MAPHVNQTLSSCINGCFFKPEDDVKWTRLYAETTPLCVCFRTSIWFSCEVFPLHDAITQSTHYKVPFIQHFSEMYSSIRSISITNRPEKRISPQPKPRAGTHSLLLHKYTIKSMKSRAKTPQQLKTLNGETERIYLGW